MAAEPKFFSKNYLDANCTLTPSSGSATKGRLFDRDKSLQFSTSGENSDATTAIITVEFLADAIAMSRTIDTVVFLNWNVKSGSVEYWNGTSWVAFTGGTFADQAASYLVLAVTSQAATKFRVKMTTTQTANAEKKVGEILLLETKLALSTDRGPADLAQSHLPVAVITDMDDGGKDIEMKRWAGARVTRYGAELRFEDLTQAELDSLFVLYQLGEFTVYPEPTERPDRFYKVTPLLNSFDEEYRTVWKSNGYVHTMKLAET